MNILMVLTSHDQLGNTGKLADADAAQYDAVFYPGGHGPLWDLAQDPHSLQLIAHMLQADKTVAAVCHAPGVLWGAKAADGTSVVKGKKVTGFTNSEEDAAGLTEVAPFLVQNRLVENGGVYSQGADWQPHVVTDGALITGQNPASSAPAAQALLDRQATR